MCGIAGYFNLDGKPASEIVVKKMTDIISHRGPDGEGQWVEGSIGLGHRRLAIIDLSAAGHQPMSYGDGRFVITYNGEVYNYKELRRELELHGHNFRSNTDTEVILAAYAEWGAESVSKFNGMFAFAIWDRKEKSLFLARDRYGIKPLYYICYAGAFLFASESKAFKAFPSYQRQIDKCGLLEYMTFQNFFTDRTLFDNVRMFPAGHTAVIKYGATKLNLNQYWDFNFDEPDEKILSENEYLEELDYLIRQAVNRQLVSDVEIGSYLSGGMDSGSITALAAQQLPYIKTFTVGFDLNSASGLELGFDERAKAEHMSYLFKTEHYEMVLKSGDMERSLAEVAYHLEEPRVGQSYPNFFAAKMASKFTKVVLSGCGGDELFGGYPWRYFRSLGIQDFESYVDNYYLYWQRLIPNKQLRKVFSPIWSDVEGVWTRDIFRDVYKNHKRSICSKDSFINHSLYLEAKTFLHGLLVVEDKLSMAHSLESRVPFLDNDLVDFGQKVPVNLKLDMADSTKWQNENEIQSTNHLKKTPPPNNQGKKILRNVMKRYIPDEVASRNKQGFSAPDASWFKGESINFTKKRLGNASDPLFKYLDFETINSLVQEHIDGKENRRLLIWSLLNLQAVITNEKL
jgi:asparagine synthase (glutamine-hydrolysing)